MVTPEELAAQAHEILIQNDRGGYTVPTEGLYSLSPDCRNGSDSRPVKIDIRPEHILIGEGGQGNCDGRIKAIKYLGTDSFVIVDAC